MSNRVWLADESLTRAEHKWVFLRVETQKWGVTAVFTCANSGCNTVSSLPVNPNKEGMGGICFDTARGVRVIE